MASNHTEHYELNQWSASDPVLREDFNADNQKIEQALVAAGNCKLALGSYVGIHCSGADHPNRLEFDISPQVVIVFSEIGSSGYGFQAIMTRGCHRTQVLADNSNTFDILYLRWEDKALEWYVSGEENTLAAIRQQGNFNQTYRYIVLGN